MATRKRRTQTVAETNNGTAEKETRDEKMIRLGEKRVAKAMNSIRLVGNLAAYRPTDKQVDTIMEMLGSTCASVEARLRGTRRDTIHFSLR